MILKTSIEKAMERSATLHPIPPITDPLGQHWKQPNRFNIEIDDVSALMSGDDFQKLPEYSTSTPSGVYNGKMWKSLKGDQWWLRWYADGPDPSLCSIHSRKILLV